MNRKRVIRSVLLAAFGFLFVATSAAQAPTASTNYEYLWYEAENKPEDMSVSWDDFEVRIIVIAPTILRSTGVPSPFRWNPLRAHGCSTTQMWSPPMVRD